ncbi:MAG: esterase family protein [Ruminococcaceae bacterium]|nr:esterase family protein [Oscillospiraceae bacterium]
MKKFSVILAALLALSFCGCQGSETGGEVSTSGTADNIGVAQGSEDTENTTAAETDNSQKEESYMEKYGKLLVEMPPEEILESKEGVNYPKFEKHTYYSQTAERDTPVNVLLPENYSEDKEYPVLYILHGYYDNEDWMARDVVHISAMLTNLTAAGEAKEMIVVLPYIYCSKDMPYCTGMDAQNTLNYDNFINDMMTDLMPFIEENFSVAKGRESTAITGFSMGGRESLFIGVSHPEIFGYVGAVCPAPGLTSGTGDPWMLENAQLTFGETSPYLLMISAAEHDGVVGGNPSHYKGIFTRNKNEVLWHSMSSTGHDASSVTPHLYNFMRMIFQ